MSAGKDFPKIIPTEMIANPKLLDLGFYFYNASLQGKSERYTRGTTSHTIHVWWARRPHKAMLPLVFASIVDQNNKIDEIDKKALEIMRELSFQSSNMIEILESAKNKIGDLKKKKVLDIFGGGGTIPQSSASLGLDTYAIDINPLSVFIQKCYLEFYPNLNISKRKLIEIVETSGKLILKDLKQRTNKLFPARKKANNPVIAYLWSYLKTCGSCKFQFYLTKRPWISKKKTNKPTRNNYIAFEMKNNTRKDEKSFKQIVNLVKLNIDKTGSKHYQKKYEEDSAINTKKCPNCDTEFQLNIKKADDRILAKVINHGYGKGKSFKLSDEEDIDFVQVKSREKKLLSKLNIDYDKNFDNIPQWSGITNPTLYGIEKYYEISNPRQRVILLEMIDLLKFYYKKLQDQYNDELALFTIGILSSFIDQLVDWNCRITMWISQNLQPGRAFSGPGVPMYWDYCEIDPLQNGPANLYSKLDRIIQGIESLPHIRHPASISRGTAQRLEYSDKMFDAVVTDPPYYDNLYYSILADFVYSWKYQLFGELIPDLFETSSTFDISELVASTQRNNQDSILAHQFYVGEMTKALAEVERVLKDNGVFAFIYSHKSMNGWLAIAEAFSKTGLQISSVQPLTIERKARPRGINSESVDTCLVIVAHKLVKNSNEFDTINNIIKYFPKFGMKICEQLTKLEFDDYDIGLTIFANGVAMIANLLQDSRDIISQQLDEIEKITTSIIPNFRLTKRNSI